MSKKAALLLNLGSPDSTSIPDVRRYLDEFLMDEKVLSMPFWKRWLTVKLFILPSRPKNTSEAYGRIWTDKGSPLIETSKQLRAAVEAGTEVPVDLGMRYGNPSTSDAVKRAKEQGVAELYVIPLYPHYAMSSYETAVDATREAAKRHAPGLKVTFLDAFYNHPEYIDALHQSSKPFLEADYDKILFSYHGLPESHLSMKDPTGSHCLTCENCCTTPSPAHATCYKHQAFETIRLFTEKAGIPKEKFQISFQSRLGREPWLKPYTDYVLKDLPSQGVKKLLMMSPAFVSDNLETLEELAMEGEETFLKAGGESFQLIPCMNLHETWVKFLQNRINNWG